jgi:hypothetical protein
LLLIIVSGLLFPEQQYGRTEDYRDGGEQRPERWAEAEKAEPLAEHAAADGQEMGRRVNVADESTDAFERRHRVEEPGETARRG